MLPVRVISRFIVPRMLTTYEVRWFYSGNIPENIESWFKQNCFLASTKSSSEREDVYLYTPECDYLGVKLRQGGLEVKWCNPEKDTVHFGSLVEGNVEKWKKWRCSDFSGESFQFSQIADNPLWVKVKKVRYSQLYTVVLKLPKAVSTDIDIDNGCSLELTNVEVNGNQWWSISLEAFGKNCNLKENLYATAALVFETYNGFPLQATNSHGYPSLLKLILG